MLVKEQAAPPVCSQDETPVFAAEGRSVLAALQPMSGSALATLYGEEARRMLVMYAPGDAALAAGMGVCVDGANGACDYRVAAPPEKWRGHTRAVLRRL